jgi:hypothetical protein
VIRARLNKTTNEEIMSEEKKLVPLKVVVDAATLDPETGKVEVLSGLEKILIEQLVREIGALSNQVKDLQEKLKPVETKEEDKGEQL